jgi:hypothetical protein
MTQDEIIAIARQVGYPIQHPEWQKATEEFAALMEEKVAAKEREACANLCWKNEDDNAFVNAYNGKRLDLLCAELIRARGEA